MSDPFDINSLAERNPRPEAQAPYLEGLNAEQREAVVATEGPVLVLAGAGTGKTRVLTTRLAHLIATRRAFPGQLLAVTFTNKAAREMQDRVGRLIGGALEGMPWLGTFHAVAAKILRRHAELVGLKPNFTILDTDDQIRLMKQVIEAANLDEKRWPARMLASVIDGWKNRGLTPNKLADKDSFEFADGRGKALYIAYQERLKSLNAADFGDLLLHCITLFTKHPDVLADYQRRFKYILVDEYQDTNVAQYLWLRLLAQKHHNICCVGDDDQSIYGWRGAEIGNILKFERDFPGAKIIRLERNYRSTPNILGAASGLIAANQGRLGKTLWTEGDEGERVIVRGVWDGAEEARMVGDEIESLQRHGHRLSDMAILVRASFQTREFEERFVTLGLPYRVVGGLRFYERQEIRDAVAYLRVVAQPDDDLAFERIVNVPKRGLGDATLRVLHDVARRQNTSLTGAARLVIETDELRPQARSTLHRLVESFDRWRRAAEDLNHLDLTEMVLDESGYTGMWQADKSPEAPGRLENLKELVRGMEAFENLGGFLEHVSLVMDNEDNSSDDKINIMTLHGAKGLEFETVFLPGWEETLFPHQRSLDDGGLSALEEERRLAYVGLTRAKKRVYISYAANRRVYNQWQSSIPSRFIDELPEDHIERPAGAAGTPGGLAWNQFAEGPSSFDTAGWNEGRAATSPGWQRARANRFQASSAPVIEGKAKRVAERDRPKSSFAIGERIFHQKFGYGLITDIEGNKLEIDFKDAGIKKVIDSFVEPA
jgi:DNA helicase-2/ATP-dependent DNA helicase PcrA